MSGKPRLTYVNGRGRMESIRWLLSAAGVEFEEIFLETREQLLKLCQDGSLLFHQLPLVEIDGMKLVQCRAILSYIAGKYNLYGKDLKERALIDMYVEGISDLMQLILVFPFSPPEAKEKNLATIAEKATERYFPVFEKVRDRKDVPRKLAFTTIRNFPKSFETAWPRLSCGKPIQLGRCSAHGSHFSSGGESAFCAFWVSSAAGF
uniref:glutathione transferase n=1 Tax=Gallus gallus TaxID=9031 RepID=A0A8V0XB81_CHICK